MSPERLKSIYEEHYKGMLRYAMSFVRNTDDAHDIVIDVFVLAYKGMKDVPAYKTWLMTLTKNKCIDTLRKREVRRYCEYDDEIHFMSESFQVNFILSETLRAIEEEMEKLPPKAKSIFKLHVLGLTAREIAEKMHLSVQTVLNQKNIATKRLQKIAHKYC